MSKPKQNALDFLRATNERHRPIKSFFDAAAFAEYLNAPDSQLHRSAYLSVLTRGGAVLPVHKVSQFSSHGDTVLADGQPVESILTKDRCILKLDGGRVVRLTGGEVFKKASKCFEEAQDLESALFEKAMQKDEQSLWNLLHSFKPHLIKCLKKQRMRPEDLEDCLASVQLAVFEKVISLDDPRAAFSSLNDFRGYVARSVNNKASDNFRREAQRNCVAFSTVPLDEGDVGLSDEMVAGNPTGLWGANPLRVYALRQFAAKVDSKLDPKIGYQRRIHAYLMESIAEAPEVLELAQRHGVTEGTMKTELHRARSHLKSALSRDALRL